MQTHYRASAILIAFLTIPFGVAIFQDANQKDDPYGLDAYHQFGGLYSDDSDYDDDYDYDYDYDDYYDDYEDDYNYDDYEDELAALQANRSMDASFFDEIFLDGGKAKSPTLSGIFHDISFGQSQDQILRKHPDYEDWTYYLPGYPEAIASLEFEQDRLLSIEVRFPDDGSALRSFTTQWGTPKTESDDYESTSTWTNTKTKMMARLMASDWDGSATLTLEPYQELNDFIAPGSKLFGFEHKDLLALTKSETQKLLEDSYYDSEIILTQPAIAGSNGAVEVLVELDEAERVVSANVELHLSAPDSRELHKLIEKKMGAAAFKTSDDWGKVYVFKKSSRVVTLKTDDEGWNSIIISRK